MGKFSNPRNRFEEEPKPVPPTNISPEEAPQPEMTEEEELEQAFHQVSDPQENILTRLFGGSPEGKSKYILLGCAAAALVMLCIALGLFAFGAGVGDPYDGLILNNVTIGGVHVGGLTRSQAEDVLRSATGHTYTQQDMILVLPDVTLRFSPADTGARLDVQAAVKAAWQYGRTGSDAQREQAYQNSLVANHAIALLPYLQLNQDTIRKTIQDYADSFGSDYREASYALEGELPELSEDRFDPESYSQALIITLGTPGLGINVEELVERVLDGYSFNTFLVEVKDLPPSSNPERPDLQAIYDEFYIAPVSASLNHQTFETIPGTYGRDFDRLEAQKLVDAADYGQTISIPMRALAPEANEDAMLYQDILGYCETPHTDNQKRNQNLKLVCQLLDGLVLQPGQVFSYNGSVGERTAERGFQKAPAYSGTELVDSVGGGVCQGSSTIYYAALLADMEIVDRINHGFPSSYCDLGMDATVNWGGPDFKFRNTSNYPIQIKAEVSDGYVKMWIMGTDERDYYIKMEYVIVNTSYPQKIYEEFPPDSGYRDGQVLQSGSTGYLVKTYRCKYSKATNELISRDYEATSSYMLKNWIVVRIIEEEEPSKPTDPTVPSGDPTDPPTQPTDPPTQPTDPPTQPTDPPTQPTDPPTQPSDPPETSE